MILLSIIESIEKRPSIAGLMVSGTSIFRFIVVEIRTVDIEPKSGSRKYQLGQEVGINRDNNTSYKEKEKERIDK